MVKRRLRLCQAASELEFCSRETLHEEPICACTGPKPRASNTNRITHELTVKGLSRSPLPLELANLISKLSKLQGRSPQDIHYRLSGTHTDLFKQALGDCSQARGARA